MENSTMLIPQIRIDTKRWTARITITEDIPIMTSSGGKKIKRYVFTDDEGNKISASIFDELISTYALDLHLFKVYNITNAQVRYVDQMYRILEQPLQWVLQRYTLIRAMPHITPNLRYILSDLTPINSIADSLMNEGHSVDVMAIVINAEECKTVNVGSRETTVHNFTLADAEEKTIKMSIWGEMTSVIGPTLVKAANNHTVVIARRIKITRFKGITLRAKNNSSFAFDPPVNVAKDMKLCDTMLPQLLQEQSLTVYKKLVQEGKMKVYTLSELNRESEVGDYWIRGFLQIYESDQKFYNISCNSCFSKIDIDANVEYDCRFCKTTIVSTTRPLVIMSVTDYTGSMEVVAFDSIAEQIIQTTPSDIIKLQQQVQTYDIDSIRAEFGRKKFLILLRRTSGKKVGIQKRHLLVAYYDENPNETSDSNISAVEKSAKGKAIDPSLSPLKRQMSDMAITSESSAKRQLIMSPTKEKSTSKAPVAVEESEKSKLE